MADLKEAIMGSPEAPPEGQGLIARAIRDELALKLGLDEQAIGALDPEAAAATLGHLNTLDRRLRVIEERRGIGDLPTGRPEFAERRDVVGRAIRNELADELSLEPRTLKNLTPRAAATILDRINEAARRLHAEQQDIQPEEPAGEEPVVDRRNLVARVVRDELAHELGLPPRALVEMSPELAATTLAHLSEIHRRLRLLEGVPATDALTGTMPERRDIIARTLRDELADKLNLPAGSLAGIGPRAGAIMLLHLNETSRRIRLLEERIAVDELTGALRRAAGREALVREMARAKRGDARLVVAFVDVDDLKAVNDSDGHAAGDRLLQEVATGLRDHLRSYDLVIRWGGDEFVCVLPQADLEGASRILREIGSAFGAETGGRAFSAGLAALEQGDTPESLVERADAELYAIRRGRRPTFPPAADRPSKGFDWKRLATKAQSRWRSHPLKIVVVAVVAALLVTVLGAGVASASPGSVLWSPHALMDSARVHLTNSPASAELDLARGAVRQAQEKHGSDRGAWLDEAKKHLQAAREAGADPTDVREVSDQVATLEASGA